MPPQMLATGPLSGIRILDMTAVVLGPFATQMLADMGAEVIKVEGPEGDMMRANGAARSPKMASVFLALNRNKRSITIDLKHPDGLMVLERLIPTVDVFVHNMRMDAVARLGIGYDRMAALNPRLVYCSATGFDQDGPHRAKPAFDDIIQAGCGLAAVASLNRDDGGMDYVPSLIADKTAGMATANAILAALLHRERNGEGQYVEVPMFETLAAFVLAEHLGGLTFAPPVGPAGYTRLINGGRKLAPTSDGHIAMLPYTMKHWLAFFGAVGQADTIEAMGITDRRGLFENIARLYAALAELTPSRTTAEWMRLCEELDVPASPIYALDDLPDHPQLKAVGLFQEMEHPTEGRIRYVRPVPKFGATPASVRSPAPSQGQDTIGVLQEIGLSALQIDALIESGAVAGQALESTH